MLRRLFGPRWFVAPFRAGEQLISGAGHYSYRLAVAEASRLNQAELARPDEAARCVWRVSRARQRAHSSL